MRKFLVAAIAAVVMANSHANLKEAEKAGTFGKWVVLRSIDKMTDKVSCTGIYGTDYSVQLSAQSMYISVRGGIETVTLRYGDSPALPFRLPSDMEKKLSTIILTGSDYTDVISSTRLRGQGATLVRGMYDFDYDMTGAADAVEHIRNDCPVLAAKAPVAKPAPEANAASSLCTPELKTRMQGAGVTKKQIDKVCAN